VVRQRRRRHPFPLALRLLSCHVRDASGLPQVALSLGVPGPGSLGRAVTLAQPLLQPLEVGGHRAGSFLRSCCLHGGEFLPTTPVDTHGV